MTQKWRGPWIGKVSELPTPNATFQLRANAVTSSNFFGDLGDLAKALSILSDNGNPTYAYLMTSANTTYALRATFAAATSIYLNTDSTPTALADLPAGFFVTGARVFSHGLLEYLGLWDTDGINDPFKCYFQFDPGTESVDWEVRPDDRVGAACVRATFNYPATIPPPIATLISGGMGFRLAPANAYIGNISINREHGADVNGFSAALSIFGDCYIP
jgi:hypothetical protein